MRKAPELPNVKQFIDTGTVLTPDMVEMRPMPLSYTSNQAPKSFRNYREKSTLAQYEKGGRTKVTLTPAAVVEIAILTAIAGQRELPEGEDRKQVVRDYTCLTAGDIFGDVVRCEDAGKADFANYLLKLGFDLVQAVECVPADERDKAMAACREAGKYVHGSVMLRNRLAIERAERLAERDPRKALVAV